MDALDNVIFATLHSNIQPPAGVPITGDYINIAGVLGGVAPFNAANPLNNLATNFQFPVADKELYASLNEYEVIQTAIQRHWYDVNGTGIGIAAQGYQYHWPGGALVSDFVLAPPYHLIYSYLLENTRILQIFERLIDKYMRDEEMGINVQPLVVQWLNNSENLFFDDHSHGRHNVRSVVRPVFDATRRNAYQRLFGIDLAFGDINSVSGGSYNYPKAKSSNQQFIPLFEKYLSEVWQGYTNSRNTSGANTTDTNHLVEIAQQIRELLEARRGGNRRQGLAQNIYSSRNLSREEYSSAVMLTWFTFIITANTNVVNFLNCQSSTIGERLMKIGERVGIPAHSKCQSIFDMAASASNILTRLEMERANALFENSGWMQGMLSSLNPLVLPAIWAPSQQSDYMNDFLIVINNWEKATGHRIKNPETNIRTSVSFAQPQRTNGSLVAASLS